jgi:hypothetical protein
LPKHVAAVIWNKKFQCIWLVIFYTLYKVNDCKSEGYSPASGITPLKELLHLLTAREITRAHANNIPTHTYAGTLLFFHHDKSRKP